MAKEIERKFLLKNHDFIKEVPGIKCLQGYISARKEAVVRIRVMGGAAYLTVKSENKKYSRDEYEYEIPLSDALEMLDNLCENNVVEKVRYDFIVDGKLWIVDEFHGLNEGLFVAEIELSSEDEIFTMPEWAGEEITEDFRFSGLNLSMEPYTKW